MQRLVPIAAGLVIGGVLLLSATPSQKKDEFFTHNVRKGESVSLICIDYYGHYSAKMGEAIKTLNPEVADINIIQVGQKLKLRQPATAAVPSVATAAAAAPDTCLPLFEKTVDATQGVVTCVEGSAKLTPRDSRSPGSLAVNTLVYPGDVIETGSRGRVEIIINRESVVRLKENTRLTVQTFRQGRQQKGTTSLQFFGGTLWTKVKRFTDKASRFQLELPTAIAGVHGTVYQTTVAADSSADVKVFHGEVAVKNRPSLEAADALGPQEVAGPSEVSLEEWTQIVRDMQALHIGKDGQPSAVSSFKKNPADSWEKWNEERDRRVAEIFGETP
jgi:LysM repeat protein